ENPASSAQLMSSTSVDMAPIKTRFVRSIRASRSSMRFFPPVIFNLRSRAQERQRLAHGPALPIAGLRFVVFVSSCLRGVSSWSKKRAGPQFRTRPTFYFLLSTSDGGTEVPPYGLTRRNQSSALLYGSPTTERFFRLD